LNWQNQKLKDSRKDVAIIPQSKGFVTRPDYAKNVVQAFAVTRYFWIVTSMEKKKGKDEVRYLWGR
jgi:ABC-type phosphate/phosphonate transport system ATPase subunit